MLCFLGCVHKHSIFVPFSSRVGTDDSRYFKEFIERPSRQTMNGWQDQDNGNGPAAKASNTWKNQEGANAWVGESGQVQNAAFLEWQRMVVWRVSYSRACDMGVCLYQAPQRLCWSQPSEVSETTVYNIDNRGQWAPWGRGSVPAAGRGSPSPGQNRTVTCPRDHRRHIHLITFLHVPSPTIRNLPIRIRLHRFFKEHYLSKQQKKTKCLSFLLKWPLIKRICWLASGEREVLLILCLHHSRRGNRRPRCIRSAAATSEGLPHFPNCLWRRISSNRTKKVNFQGAGLGGALERELL